MKIIKASRAAILPRTRIAVADHTNRNLDTVKASSRLHTIVPKSGVSSIHSTSGVTEEIYLAGIHSLKCPSRHLRYTLSRNKRSAGIWVMKVMSVYDKRRDNNKKKTNKTTHKSIQENLPVGQDRILRKARFY